MILHVHPADCLTIIKTPCMVFFKVYILYVNRRSNMATTVGETSTMDPIEKKYFAETTEWVKRNLFGMFQVWSSIKDCAHCRKKVDRTQWENITIFTSLKLQILWNETAIERSLHNKQISGVIQVEINFYWCSAFISLELCFIFLFLPRNLVLCIYHLAFDPFITYES